MKETFKKDSKVLISKKTPILAITLLLLLKKFLAEVFHLLARMQLINL